jgi:hypothetical protein
VTTVADVGPSPNDSTRPRVDEQRDLDVQAPATGIESVSLNVVQEVEEDGDSPGIGLLRFVPGQVLSPIPRLLRILHEIGVRERSTEERLTLLDVFGGQPRPGRKQQGSLVAVPLEKIDADEDVRPVRPHYLSKGERQPDVLALA